jgi:hypothetical protein
MLGSINFSEKSDRDAVIETYVSDRNGWLEHTIHAAKFKVFFWVTRNSYGATFLSHIESKIIWNRKVCTVVIYPVIVERGAQVL